jgi:hypothetical protein
MVYQARDDINNWLLLIFLYLDLLLFFQGLYYFSEQEIKKEATFAG